jgi:DNA-binding transcriptional LysR family regulator
LLRHECLFSNQAAGLDRWLFRTETGTEHLKVSTRLSLDDSVAVLLSGLAGLGIIQISDIVSGGPVSRGELVPVLADYYAARPIALSLVMPPGKKRSARVSAFVDFFISEFGHAPWRSPATEGKVKGAARKSSGR